MEISGIQLFAIIVLTLSAGIRMGIMWARHQD